MSFCLFIVFRDRANPAAQISNAEQKRLDSLLCSVPGLARVLVHTPVEARDPLLDHGAPPQLALQLYFDRLLDLEVAAGREGSLHALSQPGALPSLAAASVEHQVMAVRAYAVPDPASVAPPDAPWCTYLVAYEGPAEDPEAWLHEYLAHHTPLMARLPGIRELEVYTHVDCVSRLPWARAKCMQRNKVAFDSPAALTAALDSPPRHEMRAHFRSLPRFSGQVTHFPMSTRAVRLG
jgi:uncharacterized protein (TIGR02118 family)